MKHYDCKFGVNMDNDPSLGIRRGRITLSNQELQPVFDAVVDKILKSCLNALIMQKAEVI